MAKPVIVLADDEMTVLDSLLYQLKSHLGNEYQYETAQSIAETSELIDEIIGNNQDIVLLIFDWLIPPENSDTLLVETRRKLPNAKIIMLSGYADQTSINRAFKEAHLDRFIRKPWDEVAILKEIDILLGK